MTKPLVSCIVPVFNGERFLAEALESILRQTHDRLDIIVVDDGSTDDTASVARAFGDRIRYIFQGNAGPAAARNRGIREALGDFIAFLDADDLWNEEKLEKQLRRFEERPELAYSVTFMQNFWEEEVGEERRFYEGHSRAGPLPGYVTGTLMARREWLERTRGFNVSLKHGDAADWFQRADEAGAVGELLREVLTRRRLHSENRSRQMATGSREEFLRLLKGRLDKRRAADS